MVWFGLVWFGLVYDTSTVNDCLFTAEAETTIIIHNVFVLMLLSRSNAGQYRNAFNASNICKDFIVIREDSKNEYRSRIIDQKGLSVYRSANSHVIRHILD